MKISLRRKSESAAPSGAAGTGAGRRQVLRLAAAAGLAGLGSVVARPRAAEAAYVTGGGLSGGDRVDGSLRVTGFVLADTKLGVGLGVQEPVCTLQVQSPGVASQPAVQLHNQGAGGATGDTLRVKGGANNDFNYVLKAERYWGEPALFVGGTGRVGLGTAAPTTFLHAYTAGVFGQPAILLHNTSGSGYTGDTLKVKGGAENSGNYILLVERYWGQAALRVQGSGGVIVGANASGGESLDVTGPTRIRGNLVVEGTISGQQQSVAQSAYYA